MQEKKYLIFILYILVIVLISGCAGNKKESVHSIMIWSDGTWLRDAQGRVVLIHGINVSQKYPPYLPDWLPITTTTSDVAPYFLSIKKAGFNAVRLIIIWAGLEPTPGTFDPGYLQQIQQEVQMCQSYGLYVLLDMHQDLYSNSLCWGDGAPEWACDLTGYNVSQCSATNWGINYLVPAVTQSFQNFWDDALAPDGVGLQEHYAMAWQHVAALFATNTSILGYEIMNEPYPGRYNLFSTAFEIQALVPFYEKVASAIRKVDPSHAIMFEPSVTMTNLLHNYNTGISSTTFPQDFRNLVFAPHYYPLSSGNSISTTDISALQITIPIIAQVSSEMKTPYIVDEMGLDHNENNSAAYMTALLNEFDNEISNWMYWEYRSAFLYNNGSGMSLLDANGTPMFSIMELLSRPYPLVTAGTPLSISYPITDDPSTFTTTSFTYKYKEDGIGYGTTEIFIPEIHFPNGFTVTTSDGTVNFDLATNTLSYIRGPLSVHTITVLPCDSTNKPCYKFVDK
ncbi:MAG: cellulase family glycosylhydrolase [bacterium]